MDIRSTARLLALGFLSLGASAALAAADGSQLALPPGATVAIVVFEDLQCPDCARAHPGLLAASKASNVPLVIHDFPIPRHAWAFPAAVLARYFTFAVAGDGRRVPQLHLREPEGHHARQPAAVRGAVRPAAPGAIARGHRSRRQAAGAGPGRLRPRQADSPRIRAADVRARAGPRQRRTSSRSWTLPRSPAWWRGRARPPRPREALHRCARARATRYRSPSLERQTRALGTVPGRTLATCQPATPPERSIRWLSQSACLPFQAR